MSGAIFYTTTYGSTADYARWIGEATGLPSFLITDHRADPSQYDFLVLGSPIYHYKLLIRKWVNEHAEQIRSKPTILFTVSGASAGVKLDGWITDSLPDSLLSQMDHVALRGRWSPPQLSRWHRLTTWMGALMNRDPQARKDEMEGFDYVDKASIAPAVDKIQTLLAAELIENLERV